MTNTDSYTIARCFAAGGTLAAILAWPMSERYGAVAGVSWLLVAVLGLVGAWYDQRVVRASKARRRAYTRSHFRADNAADFNRLMEAGVIRHNGLHLVARQWTPDSVVADLLIQEDHRRIRLAEETK